jgi:hypothetical protein
MSAPTRPWKKGKHETYTCYSIRLQVCEDSLGRVWSQHDYETPQDQALAMQTKNGGSRQSAHAFLMETLKREVFVDALIAMTKDPEYLTKFQKADEEAQKKIVKELAQAALDVISETAARTLIDVVRDIFALLLQPTATPVPPASSSV